MAYLLGLTLNEVHNMPFAEYNGWNKYFEQRPYGWREDHRSAIIAQTTYQGTKPLNIKELFPSLKVLQDSDAVQANKNRVGYEGLKAMVNKKSKK
tara:strand:- start:1100 stop:1384 length:285 start_codon:yes stop_codon:yes gene_type:complete